MSIATSSTGKDVIAPPPVTASSVFVTKAETREILYSKNATHKCANGASFMI